jgi:hypothetical protein
MLVLVPVLVIDSDYLLAEHRPITSRFGRLKALRHSKGTITILSSAKAVATRSG